MGVLSRGKKMAVSAARGFKQSLPQLKSRGMKFVSNLPTHIKNADDMLRKGSNTLHTVGEYGALLSNVIGHKGASDKLRDASNEMIKMGQKGQNLRTTELANRLRKDHSIMDA
jgi:hypothetical protein